MISKLYAIAVNTLLETIRQPIYAILIWVAVFWIAFINPSLAGFSLSMGNDIKIMKDVGLATLLLYGLLASVFTASGVITREIESQTVLTVVSKPVSRPMFLVGKYLGVLVAMAIGYYFVTLTFFMAVRHGTMETVSDDFDQPVWFLGMGAVLVSLLIAGFGNYFYGWNFVSALTAWVVPLMTAALGSVLLISPEWQVQAIGTDFGDLQLVYAVVMMFCAVTILTAFAVALSTRFSQVVTLLGCAGILLAGLMSDYYLGRHQDETSLFAFLYAVLPNFQFFWVGDLITQEQDIPANLVGQVAGYAGLYTLAILGLGVTLFQTREVG